MPQPATRGPRPAIPVVLGSDRSLLVGPGGHIRVDTTSFDFAFSVIDDLSRIGALPGGPDVLAECDALGRRISIAKPATPTEPPNAYVEPEDRPAATAPDANTGQATADGEPVMGTGKGSGSRIFYNPADWPMPGDPTSPERAQLLMALLRQAAVYANGADNPSDGLTCLEIEVR